MSSPLSTANHTPAILLSDFLANAVRDTPNSLAAQKQRRLLAFTFLLCRPFYKILSWSIFRTSATLAAIRSRSNPCRFSSYLRSYCSSDGLKGTGKLILVLDRQTGFLAEKLMFLFVIIRKSYITDSKF